MTHGVVVEALPERGHSLARMVEEKDVIEFLLLFLALIVIGMIMRRRQERRRRRLDNAFRRASNVRLSGIGGGSSFSTVYTERVFNPRER